MTVITDWRSRSAVPQAQRMGALHGRPFGGFAAGERIYKKAFKAQNKMAAVWSDNA